MHRIWAHTALTGAGWQNDVLLSVGDDGYIATITPGSSANGAPQYGVLLAAPTNLHSHGFQRAMAGLAEAKGPQVRDSFWTWRDLMYRILDQLSPCDVQSITAFAQMQMLEAGFGAVCEFHYLHHQPGGARYTDIAEMAQRVVAAATDSGIGLTLLPVLYQFGGCDGRALAGGQLRFGNDVDRFGDIVTSTQAALASLPGDARIGIAVHSLRAVSHDGLAAAQGLMPGAPLHLHLAEQMGEVDEVRAAYGARPVQWLLDNCDVDARWCLIHATQMTRGETRAVARTGATVGLCPITESNLGDGIFDGMEFVQAGGRFGVGSDSNVRISLTEELRTLEYSQRLRHRGRAMFATAQNSTGGALFDHVARGGAHAAGRDAGAIAVGRLADLLALDLNATDLLGKTGDGLLDGWIFAAPDGTITDVWSAGRHLVQGGEHVRRTAITDIYRRTMAALIGRL